MNIVNIQTSISEPRLSPYLDSSGGNLERALELYIVNCQLCERLYIPLNILEITLRNNFQRALVGNYGSEWYNDIFVKLSDKDQVKISDAKKTLLIQEKYINANNIVPSLSFGFWAGLLWRRYETTLWRSCLYKAFPNAPKPLKRSDVFVKLRQINDLRNRIAHHEPIYNKNPMEVYNTILEIAGWICQDTRIWIHKNSRFEDVIIHNKIVEKKRELVY